MGYDSTMTALPVTVVETQAFIAAAKDCPAEEERFDAITMIANNPECGDLIPGGGGIRKVRFAIGGRGKRGGVRIVYYLAGGVEPPSEDSLLRATTCVSGHLGLVPGDPGRQGSLRTIPGEGSPFGPPGGGFRLSRKSDLLRAYTGIRRSEAGGLSRLG